MSDRDRFEQWARSKQELFFGGTFGGERWSDGDYYRDEEESAWQAWQAARAVPVRLPRPFLVNGIGGEKSSDVLLYTDAVKAIRQAGYKVDVMYDR